MKLKSDCSVKSEHEGQRGIQEKAVLHRKITARTERGRDELV